MFSLRQYAARSLSTLVATSSRARLATIPFSRLSLPSASSPYLSRSYAEWTTLRSAEQPNRTVKFDQPTVLFVNNIPFTATEEDISAVFSRFNPTSYVIGRDRETGSPTGYCHLRFDDPADAKRFLEAADARELEMSGRRLWADYARGLPKQIETLSAASSTLYVGNLAENTDEKDLRDIFEKYGKILRINISFARPRKGKGFAHVQFSSVDEAKAAVAAHDRKSFFSNGSQFRLDFAQELKQWHSVEPNHKVYFYQWTGDEYELRKALKDHEARIVSIYFLKNKRTDALSGSGFIDFVSVDDATEVIKTLSGSTHKGGSVLRLSYARPPRTNADEPSAPGAYGTDW